MSCTLTPPTPVALDWLKSALQQGEVVTLGGLQLVPAPMNRRLAPVHEPEAETEQVAPAQHAPGAT